MIQIEDPDDPRLDAYRTMRDRHLAGRDRFIVEGKRNTLRLLASGLGVESVLASDKRVNEVEAAAEGRAPLYVLDHEAMRKIIGFSIHTGIVSIGFRPHALSLDAMMQRAEPPYTVLVAPILQDPENLGALVRTATAFGVSGLLLGPTCCDPFYRRSIRVSMGTVFRCPFVHSDDLRRDMRRLCDHWNVELCATVLDESAENLSEAKRDPDRNGIALLLGHEVHGLDARTVDMCDRKLTIPMHLGNDSLNISVAAAVCCYHFLPPHTPIRLPEARDED